MNKHVSIEALVDLRYGRSEEHGAIKQHLAACHSCSDALERVDRERAALKEAVRASLVPLRTESRASRATSLIAAAVAFVLILGAIVWRAVARPSGANVSPSKTLLPTEPDQGGDIVVRRLR
jgi:hypothetical protein